MSTTTYSSCISYHSLNTYYNFSFPALVCDVFFYLKHLSHISTYQKFKVHLKSYFLYVAYSLTIIIYYLY